MNTLSRTLTISALTTALAGSFGTAFAQSGSTGNGSTGNPDPNATLGVISPTDNSNRNVDNMDNRANSKPEALSGQPNDDYAADGTRTEPAPLELDHTPTQPATRGESARSNNSYGHSRTTPQSQAR